MFRQDFLTSALSSLAPGKSRYSGPVGDVEWGLSGNESPGDWQNVLLGRDGSPESSLRLLASLPSDAALARLNSDISGLTTSEAASRLAVTGPNVLSSKKPTRWWQLIFIVLPNPFNILLAILAIISAATPPPEWSTFVILVVMIVLSSVVRFWQEYRSAVAVVKLQNSVRMDVKVRRQKTLLDAGIETSDMSEALVHERELVPGDILILSPGDNVPADCLVLESTNLQISQSSLTGESHPLKKSALTTSKRSDGTLFDLENIVFMGTSVISGTAVVLVARTGDNAFLATIIKELSKRQPLNTFQRGIRNVTYMMVVFMLTMVALVLVISGNMSRNWGSAALFSVSVAVGLVPEMLPAIVNTNLARGAFRLSRKKAIVKRLDSIQNLGGMSVLCSDKTGTLTKDEITLSHHLSCDGSSDQRVLEVAYVNAVNQDGKKNGVDAAIIAAGASLSIPPYKKIAEISFTFERRRSSCIVRNPEGKVVLMCKGAYEEVSALCTRIHIGGKTTAFDAEQRQALSQRCSRLNSQGYRVLLTAVKELRLPDLDDSERMEELESNMTVGGILTFLDPPKEDAALSISRLQDLGVDIRILTGDSLGTALKICQTLNIIQSVDSDDRQAITGPELARLEGTAEFADAVKSCKLFAKLTPIQKSQVVEILRGAGNCVGMLGDGINDCVALRAADVGISVDSAVTVAKDCADVILTEKALDIIVDCVTTGRVTHGNTIKYIKMVASSNFGNVFSILIASAWLPFEPMTGLQILIQNLLYDISQISLPWDRVDEDYLKVPRQWDAFDLVRFIVVFGPTSSTIDMCTFCLGWFYYGIRTANNPVAVSLFHTHWFLEGLLTQTIIVHLLRTAKIPILQSRAARVLVASTCTITAVGFVLPYIPSLSHALGFVRPANSFLGFLAAELALYGLEVQVLKMVYVRIFKVWL
ncbi:hypothetical protein VTN02DRAFT_5423 [Thermoascus thermophilus]